MRVSRRIALGTIDSTRHCDWGRFMEVVLQMKLSWKSGKGWSQGICDQTRKCAKVEWEAMPFNADTKVERRLASPAVIRVLRER